MEYLISHHDMAMIYLSNDPYSRTFKEKLDLQKCNMTKHPTARLRFLIKSGRLILASMDKSTPGAQIDKWRIRIRGAWLMSINRHGVLTLSNTQAVFQCLHLANAATCTLLFLHPDTSPDISHNGLLIISHNNFSQFTHDQLNNRFDLIKGGSTAAKMT
jgi:hypothetical protein